MRCNRDMVIASGKSFKRLALAAAVSCMALTSGCAKSLLDQSELARNKGQRLLVPIVNSIDPIDDPNSEFQGAEDVKPSDLKSIATDYVIGHNDLITISVFDLANPGVETVRTARVSETGLLSLPQLNEPLKAAGMTEQQLQRAIAAQYRGAGILQDAKVSVTVVEARGRTFNILGAVQRSGQYAILETDFRLINALVQAGDVNSTVDNIYIIRKLASEKPATKPSATEPADTNPDVPTITPPDLTPKPPVDLAPPKTGEKTNDTTGPKTEASRHGAPVLAMVQESGKAAENPDDQPLIRLGGQTRPLGATQPSRQPPTDVTPTNPVNPGTTAEIPTTQPSHAEAPITQPPYEFGTLKADEDQRVIRIPYDRLRKGDLRYNVVIRPGDTIIIPVPNVGFYYMGGHVAGVGAYNLTGQKLSLIQAIWSARGLDPFAIPAKTDLIRRIGDDNLWVRVDLEKIHEGLQPDIYLKPNDIVQVGTDWYPSFLVAIRGAFRFTYGFGFLYDRNYAPQQKINN